MPFHFVLVYFLSTSLVWCGQLRHFQSSSSIGAGLFAYQTHKAGEESFIVLVVKAESPTAFMALMAHMNGLKAHAPLFRSRKKNYWDVIFLSACILDEIPIMQLGPHLITRYYIRGVHLVRTHLRGRGFVKSVRLRTEGSGKMYVLCTKMKMTYFV